MITRVTPWQEGWDADSPWPIAASKGSFQPQGNQAQCDFHVIFVPQAVPVLELPTFVLLSQ
jgi:hypothetical protein